MTSFVRHMMENQVALGIMTWFLVFTPIIGIWAIHKYNWQHWEPFSRHEPDTESTHEPE